MAAAEPRVTFQQLIEGAFGATSDLVPYPAGFLKTFQRFWIQNSLLVPETQLSQIGFEQGAAQSPDVMGANAPPSFSVDREKFVALIDAFLETRPPLCPVLAEIVARHGAAGIGAVAAATSDGASSSSSSAPSKKGSVSPAAAAAITKARVALRDLAIPFDELCKLSLAANTQMLRRSGLGKEPSARIAGAIYKRHREATHNEVLQLTPRASAVAANDRFDRAISLSRCRLCPDDVGRYLPSIAYNTEIVTLDLSGNNIHIRGAKALAATLAGLPHLTSLSVAGNNLGFEGLQLVCGSLQRRTCFNKLDVSCNNGGPRTGAAFGAGFSARELSVAGNNITAAGIVALIPAARSAHRLVLASNSFGVCDGNPSGLADTEDANGSEGPGGKGAAARLLITLISTCEHLSFVDLSDNGLSARASQAILEGALAPHPALTGYELSLNAFDVGAVAAVCEANPQLVNVGLFSEISSADAKATGTAYAATIAPLTAALEANKVRMLEFRAFLAKEGLPNWTNEHVHDALTFLMGRRDIAVQVPVNGDLLAAIRGLSSSSSSSSSSASAPPLDGSLSLGSAISTSHITHAPRADFDALCDFLDEFRENNGDIIILEEAADDAAASAEGAKGGAALVC